MNRAAALGWSLGALLLSGAGPIEPADNPQELGRVKWDRDLDAALATSAESGKPVLLLFQEVPGCGTCVSFGRSPLSHPLLVEAIEDAFVPVAIHNNKPGRDGAVLRRYREPAWNFPVMRFLDAGGTDILPRRDRIWRSGGVAMRLIEALEAAGRPVPDYLRLAASETAPERTAMATFAMQCYWEGEARLGALDGVLATRAGWLEGNEVVEVVFDPAVLGYETLLSSARQMGCAKKVYTHDLEQLRAATKLVGDDAKPPGSPARSARASDQKFALQRNELRYLPLTPMQATKVNAELRRSAGRDPSRQLSPRQRKLLDAVRKAIAKDKSALRGLKRPNALEALPAYEDELRARLASLADPAG